MAGVIDAIMQKYVPADKLNGKGPSGSGGGAGDLESKRKEMRTLMADKSYENWQSPEHEATVAKVKALAKEMAELQKAA